MKKFDFGKLRDKFSKEGSEQLEEMRTDDYEEEEPRYETGRSPYRGRFAEIEEEEEPRLDRDHSRRRDRYSDERFTSPYEDRDYSRDRRISYDDEERYSDPYGREDRRTDRYDDRYDDRYGDRYDDRYTDAFESDSKSSRFGSMYDDPYADEDRRSYSRYDDREYDDRDYVDREESAEHAGRTTGSGFLGKVAGLWYRLEDFAADHEWLMYIFMLLLPPIGLYLLWKHSRFSEPVTRIMMAVTAIWFVVLLVLVFSLTRGTSDATSSIIVQTPAPTEVPAALDFVTETPEPVAVQPTPEATEEPESEPTEAPEMVYVTNGGRFFHNENECILIGRGVEVTEITRDNAENRNLYQCPECYGLDRYYATEGGTYYHKDKDCSGMKKAESHTLESAKAMGKQPCPKCVPEEAVEVEMVDTKLLDEMPAIAFMNAKTKDASGVKVFRTKGGSYYHVQSDCSGMKNASTCALSEAMLEGKRPCPNCAAEYARGVYCTEGGKSYHATATCSGMANASYVCLAEALVLGKGECPKCQPISGMTEEELRQKQREDMYYVYSTKANNYYHINSACGGITDGTKATLADMLKQGKAACPVCCAGALTTVYLNEASHDYHSEPTCNGMSDALQSTLEEALANGYTRCPKCWTDGANAEEAADGELGAAVEGATEV